MVATCITLNYNPSLYPNPNLDPISNLKGIQTILIYVTKDIFMYNGKIVTIICLVFKRYSIFELSIKVRLCIMNDG